MEGSSGGSAVLSCCGCCPFIGRLLHREDVVAGHRDSWFWVEEGKLRSKEAALEQWRQRQLQRPSSPGGLGPAIAAVATYRPSGGSLTSHSSASDVSARPAPAVDTECPAAGPVSDVLQQLLRTAQDVSDRSSAAPSSGDEDETPPLLRSDFHDRYQPDVVMEIASSPQTEGEMEGSAGSQSRKKPAPKKGRTYDIQV